MLLNQPCAIVDLETTGASNNHNYIIEFAGVFVDADGNISSHEQLVDPGCSVPPFISQLTGINDDMLEGQPCFEDVAHEIHQKLEDHVFIAHNVRFDYGFLKRQFETCGLSFRPKLVCTVKLARTLFPEWPRHNLDTVCEQIAYRRDLSHRAMADVLATQAFLHYAIHHKGLETVNEAAQAQFKRPSLPKQLSHADIDSIPNTHGVYRFYNDNGQLLYIGKSKKMRTRVLSHFADDIKRERAMTMAQSIHSIDYTVTAGELGALLMENREIKSLQPVYNRRQRRHDRLWCFVVSEEENGYGKISLDSRLVDDWQLHQKVYGLFKSKKQAQKWLDKTMKDGQLCKKVSADEKGDGPCFARQLKTCKGACEGLEPVELYNTRLHIAMMNKCIDPWPHDGPVIHYEYSRKEDLREAIVINRWAWVKTVKLSEGELLDPDDFIDSAFEFDGDMYKVLRRFLK